MFKLISIVSIALCWFILVCSDLTDSQHLGTVCILCLSITALIISYSKD